MPAREVCPKRKLVLASRTVKSESAQQRLSFLPLLGIIFFCTSGGPFGMEDLAAGGPGLALVLLIATPLFWSAPLALVSAELGGMLPVEGGYYRWVSLAMGRFWGFQMGWLYWVASFLDMAIYPVMFAKALQFFLPELAGWHAAGVSLAVILSSLLVNLRGARAVGRSALVAVIVVNLPFALLVALGWPKMTSQVWFPAPADGGHSWPESIGLALSVALWSYSGWECVSTVAGEVAQPARTIPLATLAAVPAVALLYLIPLGVALGGSDWRTWNSETHTIAQIAGEIIGPWLGACIALAIMPNSWSMYNSLLLSNSRIPQTMAEDGLLPRWIGRTHATDIAPARALILCSAIYFLFSLMGFRELVVLDALVTAVSALFLVATLAVLRYKRPELERPFKLPGGRLGLCLAGLSLTACVTSLIYFTTIGRHDTWKQVAVAGGLLATGPVAYVLCNRTIRLVE
jgi:amino acid transporter